MLTYPMADVEGKALGPSVVISRMKKIFPKLVEESQLTEPQEADAKLDMIVAPEPTFNQLIGAVRRDYEGEQVEEIWSEVYKWYNSKNEWRLKSSRILKGLQYSNAVDRVEPDTIRNLYGRPLSFSVSRLEQYSQCPFAYFVKYGLRAKDRKVYEFSSPDLGSFIHGILDKFADTIRLNEMQWSDITREWSRQTISELVDAELSRQNNSILNSSSRYKYMTERLKRILTRSVNIMTEHVKRSSFGTLANELAFGRGGELPAIKLSLPSGEEVQLIGRIDRVDATDLESATYFRVIDYKTGQKSFSLSDVYFGLQLQLLVYLDALLSNAHYYTELQAMPGAVLYFRVDDPMINGTADMTEEEIEKAILKKLKMNGLILKDARVVKSMDNEIEGYSLIIPARMNKGDTLGSTPSVVTEEQFNILRKYVRDTMVRICEDMLNGNIEIIRLRVRSILLAATATLHPFVSLTPMKDNKYRYVNKKKDDEVWTLMQDKVEVAEVDEGSEG